MENTPSFKLTMNGSEFECTRENTSMFTFLGGLAMYDHVFVLMNEENNSGAYLFRVNQKVWDDVANYMYEGDYPLHLNLPEVAQCDINAFDRTMFDDIRSSQTYPEEWNEARN